MRLDPAAIRAGVRLDARDTLGSTNEEALARARAGERGPLWVTARRQTAGRGRRGRAWVSASGNLHASLLLIDPGPRARAAELSFVAALAVRDAIAAVAPELAARLSLKWPNDVLVDGAKLAGILIEGESSGGRPLAVVIGIGVNCTHHPGDTGYPATDLATAGARVGVEALFGALSRTMPRRLAQWSRGDGFASIRADWLARATGLGHDLRVALVDHELVGRFEALDEAGHLVLVSRDGRISTIAAGDVFPLDARAETAAAPLVVAPAGPAPPCLSPCGAANAGEADPHPQSLGRDRSPDEGTR